MQANEVLFLQKELADTRKKLQDHTETIVSLHAELRTLRNSICNNCKKKFIPESSQDPGASAVSSPSWHVSPSPPDSSSTHAPLPKYSMRNGFQGLLSKVFRSLPTPTHIPPPPPQVVAVHKKPAPAISQHTSSSETPLPKIEPRWSVERGADAALKVTFVRAFVTKCRVSSVRFSPDGKYLAAALGRDKGPDINGAIVIYNVETSERTVLAENFSQYYLKERTDIWCLSFSPDGRHLAVGDHHQVTVWDILNKRIRNTFRGHSWSVDSVNFSPNGRSVLSLSPDEGAMILWNLRDGFPKVFSNAHGIWTVKFSPNGKYIATGNRSGMLMILDVRTGRVVEGWNGGGRITRVAFTPDGLGLLSAHHDGSVKNWSIGSLGMGQSSGGTIVTTLKYEGLTNWVYGITVSPDARWVASTSKGITSVIWDAHTAMRQCKLIGHRDVISSVDFSPSGKYLALSSWDCHVSLWKYVSL